MTTDHAGEAVGKQAFSGITKMSPKQLTQEEETLATFAKTAGKLPCKPIILFLGIYPADTSAQD